MKTLVLYYTKTGHTLESVKSMAEGLESAGSDVDIVTITDFVPTKVSEYDAFIVGSPCWAGSVGSTGVAAPLVKVLKGLPDGVLKGKKCGGIAVHGLKGGETTVSHLKRLLTARGCEDFRSGPVAKAGSLMSLGKGPSVKAEDLERFKTYGLNFFRG